MLQKIISVGIYFSFDRLSMDKRKLLIRKLGYLKAEMGNFSLHNLT